MANSFLKAIQNAQNEASLSSTPSVMTLSLEDELEPIATYSGSTYSNDNWIIDRRYSWYDEFEDENLSTVDDLKNIILHNSQINISQEELSQYIPFEMPRRYDKFDLSKTRIQFHYVNGEGYEDYISAVNVRYNESKLRFALLVPYAMTYAPGTIKFEIVFTGTNSLSESYKLITKPCNQLVITESLTGKGMIDPTTSDWYTQFVRDMDAKIVEVQEIVSEVDSKVAMADEASKLALQYATESKVTINEAKEELSATVNTAVEEEVDAKVKYAFLNYYTKNEVDSLVNSVDVSDQLETFSDYVTEQLNTHKEDIDIIKETISTMDGLANFRVDYNGKVMTFYNGEEIMNEIEINSDPSEEWTAAYTEEIETKISGLKTVIDKDISDMKQDIEEIQSGVQTEFNQYKEKTDADLASIHEAIDGLPETLQSDYYTKSDSDSTFATKAELSNTNQSLSTVNSAIDANKTNISAVSTKLVELENTVNGIDKSPRASYDITYAEDGTLTHWEITGEGTDEEVRIAKSAHIIKGGSGGGGTSTILKIEYVTKTPLVVTTNDKALITYNFSGTDSSGDQVMEGIATWKIGNTIIATTSAIAGENTFDATDYITIGSQKLMLSIVDDAGSIVTKSWTVQKIDVRLESTFNDKLTYPIGEVAFDYTPYGATSKDIHFVIDGKEIDTVTTTVSGIPMAYSLPKQEHGAHLVDVYMTATINNNTIESNHITKDVIWYDETSTIPVIGCIQQNFKALQYDTTNIVYTVYDPTTETPRVELAVDGEVKSTLTLDSNTQTWQFKTSDIGDHVLTITCGETVKTLYVTIEKLDIEISPVTAGLVFDFNPVGKSNSDSDRIWSNENVAMTVSDNFDWVNGGYQIDTNGDQYFCIKAGTSIDIDYQLFADDAKRNGKEMKLIFKTANVQQANAQFMTCVDNTTGSDHIGIEMFAHEAFIYGSADKLYLPYSEKDIIEFEFNINKDTESISEFFGCEDGVPTRHMVYDDSFNFTQTTPKTMKFGSDKCDLHIYRLKVYNTSLNARSVLNNFIADARNAEEMINRYNRNLIYDENGQLTPESLATACPWLRVYKLSAPYFTAKKSDKVYHTTIQQIYKDGDPILDNWTAYNVGHSGQGTSSDNYGSAGRNLDFIMNKSDQEKDGIYPYFILGDGKTKTETITQTRTSVPVAYLNFKANIASSNNFTNALLAKRYNTFNPYNRPFVREEGFDTSMIWDTMQFHNAVVFIQETNDDISTHREFADTNWHKIA